MKGSLAWFSQAASHYATMWIGEHYGKHFPMHFVCGFPRSGTTWFSELLADYLNLPRPRHYIFPIGFASVLQTHSEPSSGIRNCFYIIRDGRDVIVSYYYYIIDMLSNRQDVISKRIRRQMDLKADPADIQNNMPAFIEYIFKHPVGTKSTWSQHTSGWLQKSKSYADQIVIVRYEELLEDSQMVFANAIQAKYGSVDEGLVIQAVRRQEFQRQRNRPSDQHRTTLRKGKTGEWRNHFTQESAAVFKHYAGEALIELGYEKDLSW